MQCGILDADPVRYGRPRKAGRGTCACIVSGGILGPELLAAILRGEDAPAAPPS